MSAKRGDQAATRQRDGRVLIVGGTDLKNVLESAELYVPTSITIGVYVTELAAGQPVVLQNNGGDNLTMNANGTFTFATQLALGAAYAVTVLTSPPGETCVVTNGSSIAPSSAVTNITVACQCPTAQNLSANTCILTTACCTTADCSPTTGEFCPAPGATCTCPSGASLCNGICQLQCRPQSSQRSNNNQCASHGCVPCDVSCGNCGCGQFGCFTCCQ